MDELLLIFPKSTKGDASQKEAFPFMSIAREFPKKPKETEGTEEATSDLGLIPSFEEMDKRINDQIQAHPYHKAKTFMTEVPHIDGTPKHHQMQQEVWFVPLMFILFWGFGLVLTSRFAYIVQAIREFFYPKSRSNVFSDRITDEFGFKSAMTVLSFCTITLFCQLTLSQLFHMDSFGNLQSCLRMLLIFVGYIIFKVITTLYLCSVFFDKSTFSTVRHSYATIVFALGMTLFPIVLIASFTEPHIARYALILGCVFCVAAALLYLYKILSIFFTGLTSIFYLILYLCTLEILPIIALVGITLG